MSKWGWWFDAACRGHWDLFDSTDLASHRAAKKICDSCPVFADCQSEVLEILRLPGASLVGTWSGRLFSAKSQNLRELRRYARVGNDAV